MTRKKTFAVLSGGILVGYYMTKTIQVALLVGLLVGGFVIGMAYEQYKPTIMIGGEP